MQEELPHGGTGIGGGGVHGGGVGRMPLRSYEIPKVPLFSQKREYLGWDIDHYRYEVKKILGRGAYGIVVEAFDHFQKCKVAIKRINDIFGYFENTKRIYREVCSITPLAHLDPTFRFFVALREPITRINARTHPIPSFLSFSSAFCES